MDSELNFIITINFLLLLNIVVLFLKKYNHFIIIVLPYISIIDSIYFEDKNIYQGVEVVNFVLIFSIILYYIILYILISFISKILQYGKYNRIMDNLNIIIVGILWLVYFIFLSLGFIIRIYIKSLIVSMIATILNFLILIIVLFLLKRELKGK